MLHVPAPMRALASLSLLAALIGIAGCRRDNSYELCTPGNSYLIGCSAMVGLECTGDPTLTVCTDDITPSQCVEESPARIAYDDDTGSGLCPEAIFVCPPSGRVSVNADPYRDGNTIRCVYDLIDRSP
jgi:hypothetical protein